MITAPSGWLNNISVLLHRNRNLAPRQISGLLIATGLLLMIPLSLRSQEETKKVATVKQKTEQKTEQKVASPAAEKADPKAADTYSTRLFLTDSDGSNPKQMTVFPEYTSQGSPEWSADGKYLCFDVWKMGGSVSTGQVAIVNADGTNPRTLSDGLMPSFSPGGKRIAFSRSGQNRGIWIMSIEGPETELVQIDPEGWGTSWGSDGRIAYTSFGAGGGNITIVNVVEGTRDVVFDEAKSPYQQIYWNFAWSPNCKRIAFKGVTADGKKELGVVDSRGEKFGLIRRPDLENVHESMCWTRDGSRVVVTRPCADRENRPQVYTWNPDDKDAPLELLPKQDPQRPVITVAPAPDGKKLAMSCLMPVAVAPAAK